MMSVNWIFQRVKYKTFDCHHHVLSLSLSCIILVHGTQKYPLSNPFCNTTLFFGIGSFTVFYFTIPDSDLLYFVYFNVWQCYPISIFKCYYHLSWQVLNHVWFMFDILSEWMWEYIVGIKILWMNNKIFFVCNTNKELDFCLSL